MGAFNRISYDSLWVVLGGIILIVGTAGGIALLRDEIIQIGDQKKTVIEVRSELFEGRRRIFELSLKADQFENRIKTYRTRRGIHRANQDLKARIESAKVEISQLEEKLAAQKAATNNLREDFVIHRMKARSILWTSGEGRSLGDYRTPSGDFYKNASISGVDSNGIRIRHESGSALLSPSLLSNELLQEFDLRP